MAINYNVDSTDVLIIGAALVGVAAYFALGGFAGIVGKAVSSGVKGVAGVVGVPDTDPDECVAALKAGRYWDASFKCPAGEFLGGIFGDGK